MSKETKRTFTFYSAWDYEREEKDLDRASEQGWQLLKAGLFSSKFVKNPDLRYRYQLDYREIEDKARYLETFREQGWEYVDSTFNGWHYFRKVYDPDLPEEAYRIFTDEESLREMNGRWIRLALGLGAVIGAFLLAYLVWMILRPKLPTLFFLLSFLLLSVMLVRGALVMKRSETRRARSHEGAIFLTFIAAILLCLITGTVLAALRPSMNSDMQAGSVDRPIVDERWNEFSAPYTDFYYLDLEFEAPVPMTFRVLDKQGGVVYSASGVSFCEKGIRLRLPRGTYEFSMDVSSGYRLDLKIR